MVQGVAYLPKLTLILLAAFDGHTVPQVLEQPVICFDNGIAAEE